MTLFHFVAFDGGGALSTDPTGQRSSASVCHRDDPRGRGRAHAAASTLTVDRAPTARRSRQLPLDARGGPHLQGDPRASPIPTRSRSRSTRATCRWWPRARRTTRAEGESRASDTSSRSCRRRATTANSGAAIEVGQTTVTVDRRQAAAARPRGSGSACSRTTLRSTACGTADEPGLPGFQVTIDDAGGTYGMSGGHQSTDAFGNKLGTTLQALLDRAGVRLVRGRDSSATGSSSPTPTATR